MGNNFQKRRKKLIESMKKRSVLLIDSGKAMHKTTDQFFPYEANRNFFYLTGLDEENIKLLILKGENETKTMLFIDETTEYMRTWVGECISKEEASKISGVEVQNIFYNAQFTNSFSSIMSYQRGFGLEVPKTLYLDLFRINATSEPLSYTQFQSILNIYKELKVKDINEFLSYLRMFKDEEEINELKSAIAYTNKGLTRILDELKKRTNEGQLVADFMHEITLNGSRGYSFNIISASGKNATILHYEDNNNDLNKGDLILLDLGALSNNYGADISRTFPISGSFTKRQKELYNIVLNVNKETIKFVKPGISWKELNDFAKDLLAKECINIGLIKEASEITKYYYHSVGHFLGLDVHDIGQTSHLLQEGMVITIEPGLYIKEEGIGIRIEDDILVTKTGSENLSKEIIKEVKDIEEYLSKA